MPARPQGRARNRASAPARVSGWDRAARRWRLRQPTTKPSSDCSVRFRPRGRMRMSPSCIRWRRLKWCRISPRTSRRTRPATTSTRSPTSSSYRATSRKRGAKAIPTTPAWRCGSRWSTRPSSAPPAGWSRAAKRRPRRQRCGPSCGRGAQAGNSRRSSRPDRPQSDEDTRRRGSIRGAFFLSAPRHRNNNCPDVLNSDQAGSPTAGGSKDNWEDSMATFAKIVSGACFGLVAAASLAILAAQPAQAQSADTSFFLTSTGIGNGGNLGGLAGADNYCQTLAQAAGANASGVKTWRAYLSTQAVDGQPAVNARDRIGKGPWQNSKGVVIARDVAELHGANNLPKQTALSEKGDVINGRGDPPNRHDVLTGSQADG